MEANSCPTKPLMADFLQKHLTESLLPKNQNIYTDDEIGTLNGSAAGHHAPEPTPAVINICNGHYTQKKTCHDEVDTLCGCGKGIGAPSFIQGLAHKNVFLVVFCLGYVLQGMFYTYFASVLSTIERLFQIQSKITGVIMSATEIGQIGGSLFLSYYGGRGHRPKWIGFGMMMFSFCSLLCALPHFFFGHLLIENFLATTPSEKNLIETANICHIPKPADADLMPFHNATSIKSHLESQNLNSSFLTSLEQGDCYSPGQFTRAVLVILFVALLGVGLGQTAAYNLGIPYIDDNVQGRNSPLYLAITMGIRILGPTFGFVLGSQCTRLYVQLLEDPGFTSKDPRWIGAWWLGIVAVSVALFFISLAMLMFPQRLPGSPSQKGQQVNAQTKCHTRFSSNANGQLRSVRPLTEASNELSIKGFANTIKRLVKNDILMLRTASTVLHMLPIAGLYTFLPKYLETQFRFPVYKAAMISGVGGILIMGVGMLLSGMYIRKTKPSARLLSGWIAWTALAYSDTDGILCNRTSCGMCDDSVFAPVCSTAGKTFFSACHIGCSSVNQIEDTKELKVCRKRWYCCNCTEVEFSDCECLSSEAEDRSATLGFCDLECHNFHWYLLVFCFFVFIYSTSEVGGMMLNLRCVEAEDKAMSLGIISMAIGLFANVPCPIIYGAVVDSACIHWQQSCGNAGACQLYDSDFFRMFFHGTTCGIMLLAFLVDLIVWTKADRVSLSEDNEAKISSFEENGVAALDVKELDRLNQSQRSPFRSVGSEGC